MEWWVLRCWKIWITTRSISKKTKRISTGHPTAQSQALKNRPRPERISPKRLNIAFTKSKSYLEQLLPCDFYSNVFYETLSYDLRDFFCRESFPKKVWILIKLVFKSSSELHSPWFIVFGYLLHPCKRYNEKNESKAHYNGCWHEILQVQRIYFWFFW